MELPAWAAAAASLVGAFLYKAGASAWGEWSAARLKKKLDRAYKKDVEENPSKPPAAAPMTNVPDPLAPLPAPPTPVLPSSVKPSALPEHLQVHAVRVELEQVREELKAAQGAAQRFRERVEQLEHGARLHAATGEALLQLRESSHRLRKSLDEQALELARVNGELAAQRAYNEHLEQQLMRGKANERDDLGRSSDRRRSPDDFNIRTGVIAEDRPFGSGKKRRPDQR